jgi:hypothetical protein
MHGISGKLPVIVWGVFALRGYSLYFSERVEAFEFETAVVAQQLMQAGRLKQQGGVIVPALDARTFAPGTPHAVCLLDLV